MISGSGNPEADVIGSIDSLIAEDVARGEAGLLDIDCVRCRCGLSWHGLPDGLCPGTHIVGEETTPVHPETSTAAFDLALLLARTETAISAVRIQELALGEAATDEEAEAVGQLLQSLRDELATGGVSAAPCTEPAAFDGPVAYEVWMCGNLFRECRRRDLYACPE